MSNDKTTLADVQPGGRVRLGDQAERARFEDWYVQNAFDYTTNPIGSRECALMWNAWDAALSAQPSPGGQDALDCIGRIEEAIEFRVPHDIYAAVHGELAELKAALAARQPVGEPVGRVRTRVDGEFIAELLPGVADRVSNMAPLYLLQPAQAVDLGPLWVSVNDRLPSEEDYGESGDVVVRYRYNAPNSVQGSWDVGESRHDADDSEWNNGWLFGSCDYAEVSHWMPKHALLSLLDRLAVGQ